jgi:DNA invertase Pin-like site-specific DNA recombinase
LEAQKEIIRYFVERDGGNLIADYEECYTGKELSGCRELRKAIEHAKREHATLIIAKSDRFRNTAEALQIYEEMGDGNIMFCDLPTSDKFSLTLFFALAEREALLVSIRTKQALAVKKAQGCKLGAANDKYAANFNKKSEQKRKEECMKRGATKNARHMESRDVKALRKILKMVYPDATKGDDMATWKWSMIDTKRENRMKVFSLMRNFKEMDESGGLFRRWRLDDSLWCESREAQQKLSGRFAALKKSVMTEHRNKML